DTMSRPHTTPTRREDTQLTPCITAKKRRRLTPRSTARNKGLGADSPSPIASWRRSGLGDTRGPPTLAIGGFVVSLAQSPAIGPHFPPIPLNHRTRRASCGDLDSGLLESGQLFSHHAICFTRGRRAT